MKSVLPIENEAANVWKNFDTSSQKTFGSFLTFSADR